MFLLWEERVSTTPGDPLLALLSNCADAAFLSDSPLVMEVIPFSSHTDPKMKVLGSMLLSQPGV